MKRNTLQRLKDIAVESGQNCMEIHKDCNLLLREIIEGNLILLSDLWANYETLAILSCSSLWPIQKQSKKEALYDSVI